MEVGLAEAAWCCAGAFADDAGERDFDSEFCAQTAAMKSRITVLLMSIQALGTSTTVRVSLRAPFHAGSLSKQRVTARGRLDDASRSRPPDA